MVVLEIGFYTYSVKDHCLSRAQLSGFPIRAGTASPFILGLEVDALAQ